MLPQSSITNPDNLPFWQPPIFTAFTEFTIFYIVNLTESLLMRSDHPARPETRRKTSRTRHLVADTIFVSST